MDSLHIEVLLINKILKACSTKGEEELKKLQANLYLYYFEKDNLDFIIIYNIIDNARLNEMEGEKMDK